MGAGRCQPLAKSKGWQKQCKKTMQSGKEKEKDDDQTESGIRSSKYVNRTFGPQKCTIWHMANLSCDVIIFTRLREKYEFLRN